MSENVNTNVEPRNGFGLTALILALVGAVFGLIPFTGFLALILGIVGLALGLAGLGRLKRGRATNRKTTWAGIVASLGVIALGIWGITIVFGAVDQFDKDMQELDREMSEISEGNDAYTECVDAVEIDDPQFSEKLLECDELL